MNVLDFIMDYEAGELDDDAIVEGFQYLVDTGMAWQLQGHYGRTAAALIEAGLVTRPTTYMIVRFFQDTDKPREIIRRGLTLAEAQEHCHRDDTRGDGWFDGYEFDGYDEEGTV